MKPSLPWIAEKVVEDASVDPVVMEEQLFDFRLKLEGSSTKTDDGKGVAQAGDVLLPPNKGNRLLDFCVTGGEGIETSAGVEYCSSNCCSL